MSGAWKRTSDLALGDSVTKAMPAGQLWSGFVLVDDKPEAPVGAPAVDILDLFSEGER